MRKLLKGRLAISSVVAALIAILLISAFTGALIYISQVQMQSAKTGAETSGKISERLRENLEAALLSYDQSTGTATLRVNNTGEVPLAISYVLLVNPDGSLTPVSLQSPVRLIPLESKTFTVNFAGSFARLGLQTERGNVFPVVVSGVTQQVYTVTFYILDSSGSPVSGATLLFNGVSYSHGSSTSVASGSYSLSTGTIPSGYTFSQWETSGGVAVASPTASSTTATVSGSGTITMRLASAPTTASVTFSASGLGSDASGTVLTVDGAFYSYSQLPITFTWAVGSTHTFEWITPVSAGSGKRYVWVSTSGLSTSRSGSITVPSGGGSVSATYKTQYQLTMSASPSGGGTVSPGSGWYDAGSSVAISASPASGWAFERWVGSGTGSYSGTSSSATITMNAPITETAYFYTFSVSVSPTSGSTTPGGTVTATVTVSLTGGYSSSVSVSLSASGLPSGASASFSPSSVTISPSSPTASGNMTITTSSSTPTGTYTITITGTGGGLSKSTTYTLTVNPPAFDYSISVSPSSIDICRGASKTATVTVSLISGSTTTVSLSATSDKSGLTFSFSPSSGNPTFTSTLTITASLSATLGTHTVTIKGSGGGLTRTATLTVYVNDWSISVSPSSGTVNRPISGSTSTTATVTVQSLSGSGSSMTVTLSASGAPSGVTVSFSPSSVTVSPGASATSTMTITVSSSAPGGTYTITVTGASSCGTSKSTPYTLTIAVPIIFDAFKISGKRFNSIPIDAVLNVDGVKYYYNQLPKTFYWTVGSTHVVAWYSGISADESTAITGTDTWYYWDHSEGIFTSQNGYLTVPSSGGTVTAYYVRKIMVIEEVYPTGAGTVSPSSGAYPEGQPFTATPNSGYSFHHWVVKPRADFRWTSLANPINIWDPCYLKAVFFIRLEVWTWDAEWHTLPGVYVTISSDSDEFYPVRLSGYTNEYGQFYGDVPYGYATVTVAGSASAYGTTVPFWKSYVNWAGESTSTTRTIFVYQKTRLDALYKVPIDARDFVKVDMWYSYPNFFVNGWVKSRTGSYVNGVGLKVTFAYTVMTLYGPTKLFRQVTTYSRDLDGFPGYFEAEYTDWFSWVLSFDYVIIQIISVPDGYTIAYDTVTWYP